MSKRTRSIILSLTLLLSLSLGVQGQGRDERKISGQAISYGFVSPNVREDLKLEEAIKNLNSADEVRLLQETRTVACRVRAKTRVSKALGNWADGAENSLIFRIYSDEPSVRYAAASLGKAWRQKTVLYFRRQASGKARMYVISVRRQHRELNLVVRAVAKTLDDAGVFYRTLVPLRTRVMVYVVDLSNELQPQVLKAAGQLQARPLSLTGSGGFIGNDTDREKAQEVFSQEIKAFESHHSLNRRCRNAKPRTWNIHERAGASHPSQPERLPNQLGEFDLESLSILVRTTQVHEPLRSGRAACPRCLGSIHPSLFQLTLQHVLL